MSIKNTTYPQNLIDAIAKYIGVELSVDYSREDVLNGISAAISMLTDQEQKMVIMRYRYHYNLEEVGSQFGVTNERARQIIVRALRKLTVKPRRLLMTEGLEGYIEAEAKRSSESKIKIALRQEYMRGYEDGYAVALGNKVENNTAPEDQAILVTDLNLPIRATNCLVRANLGTLDKVLAVASAEDIRKIRNLGVKSSATIAKRLNDLGFVGTVWDEYLEFWHEPELRPVVDVDVDLPDDFFDED